MFGIDGSPRSIEKPPTGLAGACWSGGCPSEMPASETDPLEPPPLEPPSPVDGDSGELVEALQASSRAAADATVAKLVGRRITAGLAGHDTATRLLSRSGIGCASGANLPYLCTGA